VYATAQPWSSAGGRKTVRRSTASIEASRKKARIEVDPRSVALNWSSKSSIRSVISSSPSKRTKTARFATVPRSPEGSQARARREAAERTGEGAGTPVPADGTMHPVRGSRSSAWPAASRTVRRDSSPVTHTSSGLPSHWRTCIGRSRRKAPSAFPA
jgi:hypothetical protein